ncbi:MAG: hypothetical protein ACFFD2_15280 [Promethearchaeota archaeon]
MDHALFEDGRLSISLKPLNIRIRKAIHPMDIPIRGFFCHNIYEIKKVPAIIIEDSGIHYRGISSSPELMIFIQSLVMK